jgi:hypothetical protein
MFKVVIMLDCDECGNSFYRGNVCTQKEMACTAQIPVTMELEMRRLAQCSELYGWRLMRDFCICPECIQIDLAMADDLEEDYHWNER